MATQREGRDDSDRREGIMRRHGRRTERRQGGERNAVALFSDEKWRAIFMAAAIL